MQPVLSQVINPMVLGKNLCLALFKIQGELEAVKKDSTNPHFRSKYVNRDDILDAVLPLTQKHGVLLMQYPACVDAGSKDMVYIDTLLYHVESGEYFVPRINLPVEVGKANAQGHGSGYTYAERYALTAIFMLRAFDDDGNAASIKTVDQTSARPTTQVNTQNRPVANNTIKTASNLSQRR